MSNRKQVERKLKAVPTNDSDIESLALKAKEKRQQQCSDEINKLLQTHNCLLRVDCQLGSAVFPMESVMRLPIAINVIAKEKQ